MIPKFLDSSVGVQRTLPPIQGSLLPFTLDLCYNRGGSIIHKEFVAIWGVDAFMAAGFFNLQRAGNRDGFDKGYRAVSGFCPCVVVILPPITTHDGVAWVDEEG